MNDSSAIIEATCEAEDNVIGAILINASDGSREAIIAIRAILQPQDFRQDINRIIYTGMLACPNAPHQINVAAELARQGTLQNGVIPHLHYCVSVSTGLDYVDFARDVKEYSQRRRGITPPRILGAKE